MSKKQKKNSLAQDCLESLDHNEKLLAAVVASQKKAGDYVLRSTLLGLNVPFPSYLLHKSNLHRDTRYFRHNQQNASACGVAATVEGQEHLRKALGDGYDICVAYIRSAEDAGADRAARPERPAGESEEELSMKRPRAEQSSKKAEGSAEGSKKAKKAKKVKKSKKAQQGQDVEQPPAQQPPAQEPPAQEPPEEARDGEPAQQRPEEAPEEAPDEDVEQPQARESEPAQQLAEDVEQPPAQQDVEQPPQEARKDEPSSDGYFTDSFRNELADVWWEHMKSKVLCVDTITELEEQHKVGRGLRGPDAILKVHDVLTDLGQYDPSMQMLHALMDDFACSYGGEAFIAKFFPVGVKPEHLFFRPYEEGGSDAGIAEQIELIIFEARNERRRV